MSIAMEKFASEGHFATYNPFRHENQRIAVFQLQCRCCGYEPDAYVSAPRICPQRSSPSGTARSRAWSRCRK